MSARGTGASSTLAAEQIAEFAAASERAGYSSFWLGMDRLGADLPRLCAHALASTATIDVGIGVVPTDAVDLGRLVDALRRQDLDAGRLILGVGSGQQRAGAFERVSAAIAAVRRGLPDVRVACGAHGPRMLRHVVDLVDAICLSWLTPDAARLIADIVDEAAAEKDVPRPELYLYTRLAVGVPARTELAAETRRYGQYPVHRHNFIAMGSPEIVGVVADDPSAVIAAVADYEGSWQIVVRPVVTADTASAEWVRAIAAAAPRVERA